MFKNPEFNVINVIVIQQSAIPPHFVRLDPFLVEQECNHDQLPCINNPAKFGM
jgi:hypothetical protein